MYLVLLPNQVLFQDTILPETKIAPEHGWLEDENSFWGLPFFSGATVDGSEFPNNHRLEGRTSYVTNGKITNLNWLAGFLNHQTYVTVDGRNPAPVDILDIPLFARFYTSQVVVWDLNHQQ